MKFEYEDILHLPRHVSERRARMSPMDRAAQFSPFAALTGFDQAVEETGRLTQQRIELDVDGKAEVNEALSELCRCLAQEPKAAITHFVPDERKAGGSYTVTEGRVLKISSQEGYLVMDTGAWIFFQDIVSVQRL